MGFKNRNSGTITSNVEVLSDKPKKSDHEGREAADFVLNFSDSKCGPSSIRASAGGTDSQPEGIHNLNTAESKNMKNVGVEDTTNMFVFRINLDNINTSKSLSTSSTYFDETLKKSVDEDHQFKTVTQREIAEGMPEGKESFFFLLLAGELLGDIFAMLKDNMKEHMTKECVAITDDCLRLFFLAQTLARASEYQQTVTILLLEALLLVFILSTDGHSQELDAVNSAARKIVSHLVQIPSIATQIKDVMLTMPA